MTVFTLNYHTAPSRTASSLFKRAAAHLQHTLLTRHTQNMLVQFDDRLLVDVGLTRAEVGYPVNHPIWNAGLR